MNKKRCIFLLTLPMALLSAAQNAIETEGTALDVREDTSKVTTIADIVKVQEQVSSRNYSVAHYENIWTYASYFDIAYNNTSKLTPKEPVSLGVDYNNGVAPGFKSDWGMSLVLGHNYGLHKPIAGIAKFNIDYSYIDLNLNHYNKENGSKLYDSSADNNGYRYIPWCMEKYEANYGMSVGASVTAAPFVLLDNHQLHYIRFNLFYHVGYHVSLLMVSDDSKYDINPSPNDASKTSYNLNFGHGFTNSFGFRVSWKTIGLGYEIRTGGLRYANLQKSDYGRQRYKFDCQTNRIFLEIRY